MVTHSAWQALGAGGLYGGNTVGAGSAMPVARSELEATRLGTGRVPQAEYPDGYLGSIRSRRDDRLLDSSKNRVNQRSYQRGVHKGERIDPADYRNPPELQPDRGLRRQMRGRVTDNGIVVQRASLMTEFDPAPHLVNDGKADTVADQPYEVNRRRREQLSRMMPRYSV